MERWEGKVAVVTGACAGIGAAIIKILLEKGLKVVGVARRIDKIQEISSTLDRPGQLLGLKCDITNEESILKCFKFVVETFGGLHVLINNAGVLKTNTSLTQGCTEDWKKVFDINVIALCVCTREAVRIMKENNVAGHIINMNSIAGHFVPKKVGFNVYPASKFAVKCLTESLRQELRISKSGIKVTSISHGTVRIDSGEEISGENGRPESSKVSAIRPEDVAEAVLYVLSTGPNVQVQDIVLHALGENY